MTKKIRAKCLWLLLKVLSPACCHSYSVILVGDAAGKNSLQGVLEGVKIMWKTTWHCVSLIVDPRGVIHLCDFFMLWKST